jgi:uncharacterized protein YceK
MIRRLAGIVAALLLASFISGCGTYTVRVNDAYKKANYYKGTIASLRVLSFQEGYMSMFCYATIICPVVVLIALPVDIVVDTLLVPYDYMRRNRNEDMTYAQARVQASHGSIRYDFRDSSKLGEKKKSVDYWIMYTHTERSQYIFLNVDGVPLVDGTAVIYIPGFQGYKPYSTQVDYGGESYQYVSVDFMSGAVYDRRGAAKGDPPLYKNGTTFIFYDGDYGSERKSSQVSITPSIMNSGTQ